METENMAASLRQVMNRNARTLTTAHETDGYNR